MKNIKRYDKLELSVVLLLLVMFFIGKSVIESDHLLFYIICFVLGICIYFFFKYIQKRKISKPASLGKYFSKKYPIIVQYTPPKGINPAEAGLLYNCSIEPTDLTSLIYQRKFENLIDIKTFKGDNTKRDYIKLIKLNNMPLNRPLFESEIFDSIFCLGNIKIIEGAFQLRYALMLEDLEYHGIQKGWINYKEKKIKTNKAFKMNGNNRVEMIIFGLYFFVASFSIILENLDVSTSFNITLSEFLWGLIVAFCILIGIILLYGKIDGRSDFKYTDKGAELASKVIGYSQFIKSCDENKIKLLLKDDPLFIDRTLPYATAFGVESEFLKKISPLRKDWNAKYFRGTKVPSWIGVLSFLTRKDNYWY